MDISKIDIGEKFPNEFNAIIEISSGSTPVKYEICKDSGAIFVDRFVQTSMFYPCNYGFVPHTLSQDGDPCDVLVYTRHPLVIGSVIAVRPIGVLLMEDESGKDEKILALPTTKTDAYFANINDYNDLPQNFLLQIKHFFERYKDLEPGKWVKVMGWEDKERAMELLKLARNRK